MTAKRISEDGGLLQAIRGEFGNLNDSSSGVDVETDVPRMFEFVVSHDKAVDADTTTLADNAIFDARKNCKLVGATFIPHAALAADTTDYAVYTISDGTTVYATATFTSAITDNVAYDFTLGSDVTFEAGTTLRLIKAIGGTGAIIPAGIVQLSIQHD